MAVAPSASYSFTVRMGILNRPGMLGRVTSVIGKAGGDIGAVDLVEMTGDRVFRDMTIKARDSEHGHRQQERHARHQPAGDVPEERHADDPADERTSSSP